MIKVGVLSASLALCATMWAQSPQQRGLDVINQASAEAHIEFLASDDLEGREAGFPGSRIAGDYIASNLKILGLSPLFESYYQPFEAYSKERQKRARFQVHPDSIAILKQETHRPLSMRNVLAKIEGKNPNEIVIIGAHYDHLGIDPMLAGDKIYNGAD
ncbi:MAG: M28 family peptidase, partial [Phocaeicola sp.]